MRKFFDSIPNFLLPIIVLLLCASLLLLTLNTDNSRASEPVSMPKPPELYSSSFCQIGTGNRLGTYFPVGKILSRWLNKHIPNGIKPFKATETNGSIDNIRLLRSHRFSFAMIESRIAIENYKNNHKNNFKDLRLVWPLWPDIVQILCASGTKINSISDFSGKHGFLGQKNSSTFRTSSEIIESYGLSPQNVMLDVPTDKVLKLLSTNQIQFATVQAGIPNSTVSDAVLFGRCTLLNFSDIARNRLKRSVSSSCNATIPAHYYAPNQPKVDTLGIQNALWTRSDVSTRTVELFVKLMIKGLPNLQMQHKATADIPDDPVKALAIMQRIGVPIHKGTLNYINQSLKRPIKKETDK